MMVLKFLNDRIKLILRIRGWNAQDVINKATENKKRIHSLTRWISGETSPNCFERVQTLAKILEVPVGFFYFGLVEIKMEKMIVTIIIHETKEITQFDFLTGKKLDVLNLEM